MKLLACGGRDFADREGLERALDAAHSKRPITILIHGGARGADLLAGQWALSRGILVAEVCALWKQHGKGAGPIRNRGMLTLSPDAVIAFPGGSGTADMVGIATEAGLPVWRPFGS